MLFVNRLVWDEWNIAHIAHHKVSQTEVEQTCHNQFAIRPSYNDRLLLIGQTDDKKMLAVILALKDESIYYVVTARQADKKERKIYQEEVNEPNDSKKK